MNLSQFLGRFLVVKKPITPEFLDNIFQIYGEELVDIVDDTTFDSNKIVKFFSSLFPASDFSCFSMTRSQAQKAGHEYNEKDATYLLGNPYEVFEDFCPSPAFPSSATASDDSILLAAYLNGDAGEMASFETWLILEDYHDAFESVVDDLNAGNTSDYVELLKGFV